MTPTEPGKDLRHPLAITAIGMVTGFDSASAALNQRDSRNHQHGQ